MTAQKEYSTISKIYKMMELDENLSKEEVKGLSREAMILLKQRKMHLKRTVQNVTVDLSVTTVTPGFDTYHGTECRLALG